MDRAHSRVDLHYSDKHRLKTRFSKEHHLAFLAPLAADIGGNAF
jgi:hypothetical protein